MRYATPAALEMAVRDAARRSPLDTGAAIAAFYRHRLLCRVFCGGARDFVLKGGQGVLARTVDARATRDLDLASPALALVDAVFLLEHRASIDLGDYVSFELESVEPIRAEDEYRDGAKVTFGAYLGARRVQAVSVDLVSDPAFVADSRRFCIRYGVGTGTRRLGCAEG